MTQNQPVSDSGASSLFGSTAARRLSLCPRSLFQLDTGMSYTLTASRLLRPSAEACSFLLRLENPQRLLIVARRLFRLLLRGQHPRQPRMSFGEIGVDAERCFETLRRLVESSLFRKGNGKVVRGRGVSGLEFHHTAKILGGLREIAALCRNDGESVVIIGIRRIDFDGDAQGALWRRPRLRDPARGSPYWCDLRRRSA